MKAPPRFLDCLEDEHALRILCSWAEEEPPQATLRKTAAVLGLASAAVVGTATSATAATLGSGAAAATKAAASAGAGAAASASTGLGVTAAVAAKWIGAGIVGGALAVGTAHYASFPVRHTTSVPRAAMTVRRSTRATTGSPSGPARSASEQNVEPEPLPPAATEAPGTRARAAVAPRPSVARTQSSGSSSAEPAPTLRYSDSMAAELALIDQTRHELRRGDPNAALATLGRYDAECTTAVLAPEATVLRVRALLGAGRTAEAVSLGRRFIAEHPASPHAANLRRLLRPQSSSETMRR